MAFAAFMATMPGRLIRIVAGIVLVAVGIAIVGGVTSWILVAAGAALVALGAFNYCVIGLPFGAPFSGREAQEHHNRAAP